MTREKLTAIINALIRLRDMATDETALEAVGIYPEWRTDTAYSVDERISHEGLLYRCVQAHTSQAGWSPDLTPALWARVSVEEWPEWVQPTGAQDAYMAGDKVSHNGKHWVSAVDNNVWEPSEAVPTLWTEV